MSDKALRVMDVATSGGFNLTPVAISMAIRAALYECCDDMGKLNIASLYELTSEIESQTHHMS